jgi:hypothetical protein
MMLTVQLEPGSMFLGAIQHVRPFDSSISQSAAAQVLSAVV